MRIYLASKRRLVISAAVLAVGLGILIPATAMAGDPKPAPAVPRGTMTHHAGVYPAWTEWRSSGR